MDLKFENQYICTKSVLRNFYSNCIFGKWKYLGFFFLFIGLVQIATLLLGVFNVIDTSINKKFFILFLDIGIIMIALGIIIYFYSSFLARATFKHIRRNSNGNVPNTIYKFTDEGINLEEGKLNKNYSYDQIIRVKETDMIYALMTGKNTAAIIKKGQFKEGREEEFLTFIKEKTDRKGSK